MVGMETQEALGVFWRGEHGKMALLQSPNTYLWLHGGGVCVRGVAEWAEGVIEEALRPQGVHAGTGGARGGQQRAAKGDTDQARQTEIFEQGRMKSAMHEDGEGTMVW
jgi:hypothetical protein